MAKIVELFQKPPSRCDVPVRVVFHAPEFRSLDDSPTRIKLNIVVENGDFHAVIDAMRELGGFWVTYEHQIGGCFVPWPPAAIEVLPVEP